MPSIHRDQKSSPSVPSHTADSEKTVTADGENKNSSGQKVKGRGADTFFSSALSFLSLRSKMLRHRTVMIDRRPDERQGASIKYQASEVLPETMPGKLANAPRLGDVEIGEMLGAGTAGQVYHALVLLPATPSGIPGVLQKNYVIKDQDLGQNKDEVRKAFKKAHAEVDFQRAAEGAVPVVDEEVSENHGRYYHQIMMEHGGQPLANMIKPSQTGQPNPLDEGFCQTISLQLLVQLMSLHDQGIIHRDIKPDNVLVNQQGIARLSDFGSGQAAEDSSDGASGERLFSGVFGTPAYMAPEIFEQAAYSEKADCWSLGIMLMQMLTGELPPDFYTGGSQSDGSSSCTLNVDGYNAAVDRLKQNAELSPAVRDLLLGLLSLDPAERLSAEQALNHVFFQSIPVRDHGLCFHLHYQHHEKFRKLAHLEQQLKQHQENGSGELTIVEVDALKREIAIVGIEVKSLQVRMVLEDISTDLKKLQKRTDGLRLIIKHFPDDAYKTRLDHITVMLPGLTRDRDLKQLEVTYLEHRLQLMKYQDELVTRIIDDDGMSGTNSAIRSMSEQLLHTNTQLQLEKVQYQFDQLLVKRDYFRCYPGTLSEEQTLECEEVNLFIDVKEKELLALRKKLR